MNEYIDSLLLLALIVIALGIYMGSRLFLERRKKLKDITLQELIDSDYEQKYRDVCEFIWQQYVPQSGQSDVFQGELLRVVEKLRYEAWEYDNIHWSNDHVYFCDFICEGLCNQKIFTKAEKRMFTMITEHLKRTGSYSRRYHMGLVADKDLNKNLLAYKEHNLYDILADAVAYLHLKVGGQPIPYTPKPWLDI